MRSCGSWICRALVLATLALGLLNLPALAQGLPPPDIDNPPPPPPEPEEERERAEFNALEELLERLSEEGGDSLGDVLNRLTSNTFRTLDVLGSINTLRERFSGRTPPAPPPLPGQAGSFISNLQLSTDYSIATFHDNTLDGSGQQTTTDAFLSGQLGRHWVFGLGVIHNTYRVGGPSDLLQTNNTVNFFLNYRVGCGLTLGAFLDYNITDIEDSLIRDPANGLLVSLGDDFARWGGGLLASYDLELLGFNFGATTTVASMNKKSPRDFFDNEDTAWATVFSVQRNLTESLSLAAHTTFYTLLDNQAPLDGAFWYVGGDVNYACGSHHSVGFGYETPWGYSSYSEHRFSFNYTFTF